MLVGKDALFTLLQNGSVRDSMYLKIVKKYRVSLQRCRFLYAALEVVRWKLLHFISANGGIQNIIQWIRTLSMTLQNAVRGTRMRRFDIRLSPQPASMYSRLRSPALQVQVGRFADTHKESDP